MKKYILTILALGAVTAGSLFAQSNPAPKAAKSCCGQSCCSEGAACCK